MTPYIVRGLREKADSFPKERYIEYIVISVWGWEASRGRASGEEEEEEYDVRNMERGSENWWLFEG